MLFHFMSNITIDFTNATTGTNFYATLLWIIAAIVVVTLCGTTTLTRCEHASVR